MIYEYSNIWAAFKHSVVDSVLSADREAHGGVCVLGWWRGGGAIFFYFVYKRPHFSKNRFAQEIRIDESTRNNWVR